MAGTTGVGWGSHRNSVPWDEGRDKGAIKNAPPTRGTGRWDGLFALGHGDGLGVLGFLEGTVVALVHEEDGVGSRPKVCRQDEVNHVGAVPGVLGHPCLALVLCHQEHALGGVRQVGLDVVAVDPHGGTGTGGKVGAFLGVCVQQAHLHYPWCRHLLRRQQPVFNRRGHGIGGLGGHLHHHLEAVVPHSRLEGILDAAGGSHSLRIDSAEGKLHHIAPGHILAHQGVQDAQHAEGIRLRDGGVVVAEFLYQLFLGKNLVAIALEAIAVLVCILDKEILISSYF